MSLRFGRYETINQLATGGMATVYLGRVVGVGGFERKVAIKVMHEHIADDPDFITMFLDEARLAARIHHPNVVSTIDVQKADEGIFLVMEYVEGASLRRVMRAVRKQVGVMPMAIGVRVLLDTLVGLHAAHELKGPGSDELLQLVHRDVSPHNILVGTDGISRITDFGVARAEARLSSTRGGTLKGKIAYMPPEQGRGDAIDRRADVYAAGVVLWEILTGQRLFTAEHDGALVAMILRGTDVSPCDLNADVPELVGAVCMKALAVAPEDRFATAADFADALENAAMDSGIRIAKTRDVARFVAPYKVTIDTKRPPPGDLSDSRPIDIEPLSGPREPLASAPSFSTTLPTGSQPTGTSQLSGIGAVHSVVTAPPRDKKMLIAGLGIGALAAVLVVSLMGLGGASEDGTQAAQPAAEIPTTPPVERPPEPDVTPAVEPPEPPPENSAEARADETNEKTAADAPPKTAPVRVRPRQQAKSNGKSPLGFEPDDL